MFIESKKKCTCLHRNGEKGLRRKRSVAKFEYFHFELEYDRILVYVTNYIIIIFLFIIYLMFIN